MGHPERSTKSIRVTTPPTKPGHSALRDTPETSSPTNKLLRAQEAGNSREATLPAKCRMSPSAPSLPGDQVSRASRKQTSIPGPQRHEDLSRQLFRPLDQPQTCCHQCLGPQHTPVHWVSPQVVFLLGRKLKVKGVGPAHGGCLLGVLGSRGVDPAPRNCPAPWATQQVQKGGQAFLIPPLHQAPSWPPRHVAHSAHDDLAGESQRAFPRTARHRRCWWVPEVHVSAPHWEWVIMGPQPLQNFPKSKS
jgi:hypothetical protein